MLLTGNYTTEEEPSSPINGLSILTKGEGSVCLLSPTAFHKGMLVVMSISWGSSQLL